MSSAGVDGVQPWEVFARNLPEHAGNRIHTDDRARAAGFPRALVAGVTTYAYLTHPVVAAWGVDWLRSGGGEVRLRRPVFDGDLVTCRPLPHPDGGVLVQADTSAGEARATLVALRSAGGTPTARGGEPLEPVAVRLDGRWGADHGPRLGDDLCVYTSDGIVHPAVWPSLANQVVHAQIARGSWIHTRTVVRHHALVRVGAEVVVEAVVVDRFEHSGERAVLDVCIRLDGLPVVTMEHEAIVALAT